MQLSTSSQAHQSITPVPYSDLSAATSSSMGYPCPKLSRIPQEGFGLRKRLQALPGSLGNAGRTLYLDCVVRLQCMGVRVCCDEQHLVQIPVEVVEIPHLHRMPTIPEGPVLAQC